MGSSLVCDIQENLQSILGTAAELWCCWHEQGSLETRNALVEYYYPWCRTVARRLLFKYPHTLIEWEDCVNTCSIALIDSIDRYDMTKGIPFKGFSYIRMKGSVLDELGRLTEGGARSSNKRNSDHVQSIADAIDHATRLDAVISATVEIALGQFLKLGIIPEEPTDNSCYRTHWQQIESKELLRLVEQLDEKEKFVVKSYYYQHLNFSTISDALALSRARISQIHAIAIKKLRLSYEEITG